MQSGTAQGISSESMTQLQDFLDSHPEVMQALKTLLAQQLAEQGSAVDEQSISDQMVYARLQSDPQFRADALRLMVDSGYITDEQAKKFAIQSGMGAGQQLGTGQEQGMGEGLTVPPTPEEQQATTPTEPGVTGPPKRPGVAPVAPEEELAPLFPKTILRNNPYPNLPSMQDLYQKYLDENKPLKRFGADIFRPDVVGMSTFPMDMPAGPDYVLGPGDVLSIDIWGGVSQRLARIVDREGRISLPEAGPMAVAGLTLADAQKRVQSVLQPLFRDTKVDLSVTRLRTVRVYVVGDVQRPGAYDISSLSTPLNALYAAGGPTAAGSMRIVKHYRGSELISEQDLYDLLIFGVRKAIEHLQPGDTILVPPVGAQVGVAGAVRRPAIYELKDKTDQLVDIINLAGGVTVSASLDKIKVERVEPHDRRVTIDVKLPPDAARLPLQQAVGPFTVQDGDRVFVLPINPYMERTVYLVGHVYSPGSYPYRDGMTVGNLIHSYQDVLPEPANQGEIVRLQPPDYRPQTIPFDLADVLGGSESILLQQFDTVRVFGRYETDPPRVSIYGEVLRPGIYPMSKGMTAAGLVKMAGGFKRSAYTESASLASYMVQNGSKVVTNQKTVRIGAAVAGDPQQDAPLLPGDVLTILQIPGWSDIGRFITIKGEVTYPGNYGINEGERLSAFLRRVGGFRSTAYPAGLVLERVDVRKMEEEGRQELIRRLETTSASVNVSPNATGQDQAALLQAMQQQQQQVLAHLRTQPVTGRLVVNVTSDIAEWENTPNDITLRAGDVITVPKRPNFVLAYGQVYNANAITYSPGKTADWYLRQAGGATELANKKDIYIIRANGSVISYNGADGWFTGGVLSTKMQPGDVLVVPEKFVTGSTAWKTTLQVAQLMASLALAAAVVANNL